MPTKVNILYLTPASEDIEDIVKYHLNNAGYESARKIYELMKKEINRLADFPLLGQIHPDPILAAENFRKLVLTQTYVAIYKYTGETVLIYRIVNARRDYPKLLI